MTLDESINFYERQTEELHKAIPCDGCAFQKCKEEKEQLAEWLRELQRWREFGRKNAQFINDCLLQNHIDELFSSEIKNDADILRIVNEALTLRTTNEFCKSFNKQFKVESDKESEE